MRRLNCLEVEQGLWRYVDRELPASGVAAMTAHLKRCPSCQKLYHERARQANVYRRVLSDAALGSEVSQRIVRAMVRQGDLPGSTSVARWSGLRHPGRFVTGRRFLAVAAACLILITAALFGWLLTPPSPTLLGEFEAVGGMVWRSSGAGSPLDAFKEGECLAGFGFSVPKGVELELRLKTLTGNVGARLTLTGPAELTLDDTTTLRNFYGRLDSGLLKARVSPRDPLGEPFVIRTPEALVSVVGTTFVVDTTRKGVTRLDVSRGAVDFRALDGPANESTIRVTRATGSRLVRGGDLAPVVPEEVASQAAGAGASEPEVPEESSGTASAPGARPPVEANAPQGETSPSPSSPAAASDLDGVVNPRLNRDKGQGTRDR